ncbi:MAG: Mth938-like domain-containing protein [Pseudomonadota bacterium]
MKLHLNFADQRFIIQSYGEGHVTINGERHTHSLILTPEQRLDWAATDAASLSDEQLEPLLSDAPELIIIGTGPNQLVPSQTVLRFFARQGIGLEFVSTPSACRIYNILAGEGRRVGCGLIISRGASS